MEQMEAILGFEWNSMSGICSSDEAEFMAQLLRYSSIPNEQPIDSRFPTIWQPHESNGSPDETAASVLSFPFSSSYYHDMSRKDSVNGDGLTIMDFCEENTEYLSNDSFELNDNVSEGSARRNSCRNALSEGVGGDIVISNMPQISRDNTIGGSSGSKKRSRASAEVHGNKRCLKLQKCVNVDDNDADKNWSEDDSKSNELAKASGSVRSKGGGAHNSTAKTVRAGRGSVTDPPSLYARKRRLKINERLRILQKLVPNGTKVDISTMLEEAVQYIKFLQLQIKLLSSEDLWMYAPIAYNGMDIGDLIISTPKPQ